MKEDAIDIQIWGRYAKVTRFQSAAQTDHSTKKSQLKTYRRRSLHKSGRTENEDNDSKDTYNLCLCLSVIVSVTVYEISDSKAKLTTTLSNTNYALKEYSEHKLNVKKSRSFKKLSRLCS